jgi:oxepin-CoA hydrolase/3-oxo-5,6-dehydrosuberyl-CoA semialdehyde dehydrogenase
MKKLPNYILGKKVEGAGDGQMLFNAVTGEPIAIASTDGIDLKEVMTFGRTRGGSVLRNMTFQERGLMLKKLALHLYAKKDMFYALSAATGATRSDSWIDIEGGIGNLFANASLRRQFQDLPYYIDGDVIPLSKKGNFSGLHLCVPKQGVAVHINAYNFPIWGMLEKIAVNLLAGVPAVVKPATVTSFLTELMVREILDSQLLPEGSLQLLCGSARGIVEAVGEQDVVTFTGSAWVGRQLKAHPNIIQHAIPFNLEADSLNAAVLGPDAVPGTPEFDLFVKEVHKEMTVKGGQKCTAIRRALVPEALLSDVEKALSARLAKTVIGNPLNESVRMGALAGMSQRNEVVEKVEQLAHSQEIVYGSVHEVDLIDADPEKGAFLSPILFRNSKPFEHTDVHEVEAFGPVATLIPYKDVEEAITLSNMGKGSLVASMVTHDDNVARTFILGSAAYHGRILILNRHNAKESTGHGSPLPMLTHGGPGRAGGGEEMGGKRGVLHYMQRTAIQGTPTTLTNVSGVYQPGGERPQAKTHVFTKYFEELTIGETVYTAKRTITEADIVNFANVSWDHFYAHTDVTSLDGTLFEERVAHGYFILSAAAGLFVHPDKGPVLLNYGIEEARFTKPVYAGATIGVKLTVKEKLQQEKREDEPLKGIVKFYVEVYDETDETVAVATILTMVKMRNQE